MDLLVVFLIAFGLAMDCFAISIASGAMMRKVHFNHAFRMAFFFGFFQAAMPVIGWLGGRAFAGYISGFDHWVAFGLLATIGCKMVYESRAIEREERRDVMTLRLLLILAIATSIDALAVGISLAFIEAAIFLPVIIIGITTFSLSLAGVYIGERFGHLFENKMEIAGGLILIAIGAKILLEHLF
jgi:putative Mn2+ efflux pump MntP